MQCDDCGNSIICKYKENFKELILAFERGDYPPGIEICGVCNNFRNGE